MRRALGATRGDIFRQFLVEAGMLGLAGALLGLLLALNPEQLGLTALGLLIGTPALTAIGAAGAALTVSLRRGGLLMAILVLPFSVPVLIFGVSAASAASGGTVPFATPLMILGAMTLASVALAQTTAVPQPNRWRRSSGATSSGAPRSVTMVCFRPERSAHSRMKPTPTMVAAMT